MIDQFNTSWKQWLACACCCINICGIFIWIALYIVKGELRIDGVVLNLVSFLICFYSGGIAWKDLIYGPRRKS
jgi:hypothetical protein